MIEPIEMPAGTMGFQITGEVTPADYEQVLIPPIREAIEGGAEVRCLCQVGPGFDGYEASAVWEDVKTGFSYGIGHHRAWKRVALVTDVDWIRRMASLFGWMAPGEMKLFALGELDAAKDWVAS